ncbi:hypothetical protein [Corallococcus sp. 4LFB]|uniref:hypothetical protein n=1 Tax=Corallococcus sp. 4LFB TaxID=3383249 RepID=UPI00397656C0
MKNRLGKDISRAFGLCADFLERLSSEELESFLRGNLKLALVDVSEQPVERSFSGQPPAEHSSGSGSRDWVGSSAEMKLLMDALQASKTREDVLGVIQRDGRFNSREKLVQFARMLRVHVNKSDKREMIEDKIAESIVGVRLRSEAIQGVDLKGTARGKD